MHAYDYDHSASHGAQWQELDIAQAFTTHAREGKEVYALLRPAEAFMHACMRPTEAACFHIQKCAKGIQRFLRCAYTARFGHTCMQNAACATCI